MSRKGVPNKTKWTKETFLRDGETFIRVFYGDSLMEVRPRDDLPHGRHFVARKNYFGIECVAWWTGGSYWPHWAFEVGNSSYHGIPNKCETRASALRRAWWRAKWRHEGTHAKRYSVPWPTTHHPREDC